MTHAEYLKECIEQAINLNPNANWEEVEMLLVEACRLVLGCDPLEYVAKVLNPENFESVPAPRYAGEWINVHR